MCEFDLIFFFCVVMIIVKCYILQPASTRSPSSNQIFTIADKVLYEWTFTQTTLHIKQVGHRKVSVDN